MIFVIFTRLGGSVQIFMFGQAMLLIFGFLLKQRMKHVLIVLLLFSYDAFKS